MNRGSDHSRRKFISKVTQGVLTAAFVPDILIASGAHPGIQILQRPERLASNDYVQIALIGAGGMGTADADTCITVPGVKLIAACDLYDGRLEAAKRKYGKDIFVTKDYREILSRKDIDAVIIGTPDHWHKDISVDAMNSGKAVYCEKPMVHDITEGSAVIDAQSRNKAVFQVGSQGMSSLGNEKAKQLYES